MISTIQGKLIHKGNDFVTLVINGLGFQVFTPHEVCDSANIGETLFLYTQLIVREDSLTLFGFESETQKEYFNLFLGVNGVGTKTALSIISTLSLETINRAVSTEQFDIFTKVPGIGKKTAQKIIIQLHDKIKTSIDFGTSDSVPDVDLEVLEALISLGYSVVESQSAIQSIPRDGPEDIEGRLRIALQYFS